MIIIVNINFRIFSQKSENHTGYVYHSQNEYTTDNLEVTSKYNHTWNKHRLDALVVSLSADDFTMNDTVPYLENRGVKGYFEGTQVYTSSFMLPATLQDNAPYTLEAWVLNDSISENECVADFTTSHDELEKIMLVNGTEPRCGVINHYGWYEDAGYKDMKELAGKWQHIYICFDGRKRYPVAGETVTIRHIGTQCRRRLALYRLSALIEIMG